MDVSFSVLVVCLNPGVKLKSTLDSILGQKYKNFEVIIKDGLSKDDSLSYAFGLIEQGESRIRVIQKKDKGIYDAMNQAAEEAKGRYIYFLNCGDAFYNENVLLKIAELIAANPSERGIYYGNIYERRTGQVVASNPEINAFGCYRNVPCHQACFYDRKLLLAHPFQTEYKVRADYEQFLWCYFNKEFQDGAGFVYGDFLIADYEGGGFSETKENRKVSAREHRIIVNKYMSRGQVLKFRAVMWITLAPLRTKLAGNEKTARWYNSLKRLIYRRKQG